MNDTYQDRAEAYADAWFTTDEDAPEKVCPAVDNRNVVETSCNRLVPTQTSPLKQLHKHKQTPNTQANP